MYVKIYGTPNCGYCNTAKEFCEAADIPYQYIDLHEDLNVLAELQSKIGRFKTVPQIFVDDEYVGGFDKFKELAKNG